MENRNRLIVRAEPTRAGGCAERRAALDMIHRRAPGSTRRLTLGADKGHDSAESRHAGVTPHAAGSARGSAIDGRTTRRAGCALAMAAGDRARSPGLPAA